MSNMAYCRFHNTNLDMMDCIEALECGDISSDEEKNACIRMFSRIYDYFVDEGIIEDADDDAFEEWCDYVREM